MTKRPSTHVGDRGEYRRTPRSGVPEAYTCEDITGRYEGEDLALARSRRPTDARIARLEDKHDALVAVVSDVRAAVGEVSGKLEVLPQLVAAVKDAADRSAQREHVTLTAKVEVDKATALDSIQAQKDRRALVAKVVGAALGGVTLGELLHRIGVL